MSVALVLGGGLFVPQIGRLLAEKGFAVVVCRTPDEAGPGPDANFGQNQRSVAVQMDMGNVEEVVARASSAGGGPVTCCINAIDLVETTEAVCPAMSPQEMALATMEAMTQFGLAPKKDATGELTAPCIFINLIDQRRHAERSVALSRKLIEMGLLNVTEAAAESFAPAFRVNAIGIRTARQADGHREQKLEESTADSEDLLAALAYLLNAPAVTGQAIYVDIN